MKYSLVGSILCYCIILTSQNCPNWNTSATNYCCGHDPEFVSQTKGQVNSNVHTLLDNQFGHKNFCDNSHYVLESPSSISSIPGEWFLVWNDDFNYGMVDYSFYDTLITGTNWQVNNGSTMEAVTTGFETKILNGKLVRTAKYDANPAKEFKYVDHLDNYITKQKHFDYSLGGMMTKIKFPINSRHQANIKCYQNALKTWPAYWLYGEGAKAQEIDVFEITGSLGTGPGNTNPNSSLKMTYHFKKDGNPNSTEYKEEGVHHETNTDLTNTFNQFDLIWDNWKIQWYFNSNVVHSVYRYYWQNNWNNNRIQKQYREKPMKDYNDMSSHFGDYFMRNRHFIGPFVQPMNVIYSFALRPDITPNDVNNGQTMEMENMKIWLRRSCIGTASVTQNNFIYSDNFQADIIQTGNTIYTVPGSNILLKGGVASNYNFPQMDAIYAGLNEIVFNDGFGVEEGANLFAFISSCEAAWDSRLASPNFSTQIQNEKDSLIENLDVLYSPTKASFNTNKNGVDVLTEHNEITINSSLGEIISLEFIDMKGSTIYSIKNSGKHSLTLNKEDFVPGMYTLKVQTTSNFDVKKVWVIR
ncbi:MAG: family 16 glycosylhydrolase [Bacteroidetes bacterium]|nr:family 16 glycosylhydrolase [Bacteroidota bacterium]MCA6443783.1 family 16 glycosylhydrolase [Bacteroidota bacterium]